MAIRTENIALATTETETYLSTGDSAITVMSLCNHGVAPVNVDVHVVPSGGAAGTDNLMISALEIVATDTFIVNDRLILETGDSIIVVASLGNVVTVITSFVQI